jgi:hypothetical protein
MAKGAAAVNGGTRRYHKAFMNSANAIQPLVPITAIITP